MMIEISNICFVFVFACGRPGLQSSTLPLSVYRRRGGQPWIELIKMISLFLCGPFSTEYAKQNANQQLSEITEQQKKAETQSQRRDCEMKKLGINYK